MQVRQRDYLNVIRIAGAFAVTLIHSNNIIWEFSYEPYWLTSIVISMCLYWAVPCFIMTSGALLIDYSNRYSTKTFIRKRIKKILVPYVAWCLIGISYLVLYKALTVEELSIKTIIRMILNNEVLSVYWYLTVSFTIYLVTPILTVIPEDKKKKVFEYIIVSMLVFNIAAPFFTSLFGLGNADIQIPLTTMCLFYVTGYYIDRYLSPEKYKVIYALAFGSLLVMIIGTIRCSYRAGYLVQTYSAYTALPCVIFSVGVFCVFKELFGVRKESRTGQNRTGTVSLFVNETFGVYLIHWYVLNTIRVYFGLNFSDFMYRIPVGIVTFFISWLIIKLLRKIPIVRHIVP